MEGACPHRRLGGPHLHSLYVITCCCRASLCQAAHTSAQRCVHFARPQQADPAHGLQMAASRPRVLGEPALTEAGLTDTQARDAETYSDADFYAQLLQEFLGSQASTAGQAAGLPQVHTQLGAVHA